MKHSTIRKMDLNDLSLDKKAEMALQEAVADAIAEHKRMGEPIVIWRNGKVVTIPPEKIVLRKK